MENPAVPRGPAGTRARLAQLRRGPSKGTALKQWQEGVPGTSPWTKIIALTLGGLAAIVLLSALVMDLKQVWQPLKQMVVGAKRSFTVKGDTSVIAASGAVGHPKPRGGLAPSGVSLEAAEAAARSLCPDVFDGLPLEFDPEYKTPCWYNETEGKRHCIPFFYILGNFQSGVRDLSLRLALHPDVVSPTNAAPHFWDERHPWGQYVANYDRAVPFIESNPGRTVVGDVSASTFAFTWTASDRLHMPWIEAILKCRDACQQKQPCIADTCYAEAAAAYPPLSGGGAKLTLPWLMRQAMGKNVRLIIMLRDPVERLHAAFWHYEHYQKKYGESETGFTTFAMEMMGHFNKCTQTHSVRECALAFESLAQEFEDVFFHADQLIKSMHSVFMPDWLAAFPPEDVLVLRLEDYVSATHRRTVLERVFRHLHLQEPTAEKWEEILDMPAQRAGGKPGPPEGKGEMQAGTRAELEAFYAPYNKELARLLGDGGFETWAKQS